MREHERVLPISEKFHGQTDIPTIFQEKIDRTLVHQTPAWLHDIINVTRETKEEHTCHTSWYEIQRLRDEVLPNQLKH